jgi:peptidoglycan/LPS O-acetylase OafA/YrhL
VSALVSRLRPRAIHFEDRARALAIAAAALVALSVALTPWYALDEYVPNGWDATWWARAAAAAAIATAALLQLTRDREATALAAIALACVAFRTAVLPDFGFAFDGLSVPVERRWGLYLALAAAIVALAVCARIARRERNYGSEP